jgi:Na+/H+ antiporter NhaD/arsenite permease-like protein
MRSALNKAASFIRKEAVLCISVVLALASCCFIAPDKEYLSYIDLRTILLLFSLMLVVQAFVSAGLFNWAQNLILARISNARLLGLVLVAIVFFLSMAVTNDVALLSFVPFSLMLFSSFDKRDSTFVIVMETIAANLGSMATPFGNPQNLYLYSHFELSNSEFFVAVLPSCGLSLVLLVILCLTHRYSSQSLGSGSGSAAKPEAKSWAYAAVFVLILLSVIRIVPIQYSAAAAVIVILILNRKVFMKVDYALLATFCAFFVFVGNMKRIDAVSEILQANIVGNEYWWGLGMSQIISNVPAAIMLSGFASDIKALLLGVDVGGLGTLIASLASLISFKGYTARRKGEGLYYLGVFTLWNLVFLAVLAPLSYFALKVF